jgi:hypothetical protein
MKTILRNKYYRHIIEFIDCLCTNFNKIEVLVDIVLQKIELHKNLKLYIFNNGKSMTPKLYRI